ncbi:MAG: sugar ABC transporter substrate-binding protein [Actinomycetales bacterium]|nr:sugar ABC transporter substrate-binding protein [Actinomycetales bacterium]
MRQGARSAIAVCAALGAVFALASCSGQSASEEPTATSEEAAAEAPLKFACIVKDQSATFFAGMVAGCEQAAAEFGVEVTILSGTADQDIEGSIANFEDAITGGYDGIAIAPSDSVALVPTLEKAVAAGIPVVALDTPFDGPGTVSTVATDNVAGAIAATQYLAEALGGKGKVAMLACTLSIGTCKQLDTGFTEAIAAYPDITVVGKPLTNGSREEAFNAMQDLLTAHPDLAGFFAIAGPDGMGGIEAVQQSGKSVVGVSRNCALDELNSINSGTGLRACMAQFPKQMGYVGIKTLIDAAKGVAVSENQDSGFLILDKERAQEFIDLGEFNGSPS